LTTAIKLKKATFKHIESELYSYKDTIREIVVLRNNIIFCKENDDENVGGGRSSLPSSPTERIGTMLASNKKLEHLEKIANAIEKVYTGLPEDYQKLIRLKYWTRPQTLTWEGIADKIPVSRRTAFNMRDEVVYTIAEVLGWR
jgi:RinA family phage transcriptional activator